MLRSLLPVALIALTVASCAEPLTADDLDWCMAQHGGARHVAEAADILSDLPAHPVALMSETEQGDEVFRMSESRLVPLGSDEALFAMSFVGDVWYEGFMDWRLGNRQPFLTACEEVVDSYNGTIEMPETGFDPEAHGTDYAFIDRMRINSQGTYFEEWTDAELVGAGWQICSSLRGGRPDLTPEFVQSVVEEKAEIVYRQIFESHPPREMGYSNPDDFEAYLTETAGKDWQSEFTEFSAAIFYESTRVLCPSLAEFADEVAKEASLLTEVSP